MTQIQSRPSLDQIFGDVNSPNIAAPQNNPAPQNRPSLDQIFGSTQQTAPAQAPTPGIFERLGADMRQRGANIADITNAYNKGQQGKLESTFQGVGNEFGAAGDIVAQGVSSAAKTGFEHLSPENQQALKQTGSDVMNSAVGQQGLRALHAGVDNWDAFAKENPRAARDISAYLNIATTLIPIPGLGKSTGAIASNIGESAIKNGANVIGKGINVIGKTADALTPVAKELPTELKNLTPVIESEGSTLFSKNPNALHSGLEANKQISTSYDAAKTRTKLANDAAREAGNNTPIPAGDVYNKLDNIIGSLQGKVAPGTKEAGALDQLTNIRDNLIAKNPIVKSSAGEIIPERTILGSDLMDIEKTINQGLPDNKFINSGTGKSLTFKNVVQDAIGRAGEINSEFAQKYTDYKSEATNLMKTYVNNDQLKPFWQPEDYVSWKANQENPQQSLYTDDTLNRANKLLDNLNTRDTGKISALIGALPPEQSQKIMREAFVRAKKEKISLPNAIAKVATGHLAGGIETAFKVIGNKASKTNIEETIADLKRLRK